MQATIGRDSKAICPFRIGEMNEGGQRILKTAQALDIMVVSSWFEKRKEHFVTNGNGGNQSQIRYILTRREQKRLIMDCKFILGEVAVAQHRMMVPDMTLARKKRKQTRRKGKVQAWNLDSNEEGSEFKARVLGRPNQAEEYETADEGWKAMKEVLTSEAIKVCRRKKPLKPASTETWLWTEKVQAAVKENRTTSESGSSWTRRKRKNSTEPAREQQRKL